MDFIKYTMVDFWLFENTYYYVVYRQANDEDVQLHLMWIKNDNKNKKI